MWAWMKQHLMDLFFIWIILLLFYILQDKLMTSSYSPVLTTKAVKDEYEQKILRDAHVRPVHTDKQTTMYMHTWASTHTHNDTYAILSEGFTTCVSLHVVCLVLLWLMPCAGQGCSRRHPAADVAGEVGAAGRGDWGDGCRIRQHVSQVRMHMNTHIEVYIWVAIH